MFNNFNTECNFLFYGDGETRWMFLFIAISYLTSTLPRPFYEWLQISHGLKVYRNVTNVESIKIKLAETYNIEKSHIILFIFALLTNIYAVWTRSIGTAIILFIGNIIFNLYPVLLQQYNRIRYMRVLTNFSYRTNIGELANFFRLHGSCQQGTVVAEGEVK